MTADNDLQVFYSAKDDPEAVKILEKYQHPENYVAVLNQYRYSAEDAYRIMAEYRHLSGQETLEAMEHIPFTIIEGHDDKMVRLSEVIQILENKFGSLEK